MSEGFEGAASLAQWAVKHGVQVKQIDLKNTAGLPGVPDEIPAVVVSSKDGLNTVVSAKALLEEYREFPQFREGTAILGDLPSFIAHTNRFKGPNSVIFADPDRKAPSLTAILDYHEAGPDDAATPNRLKHRGVYKFPLSDEWQAWQFKDGAHMTQEDFAVFLEDRIGEVIAPPEDPEDSAHQLAAMLGGKFAGPSKLLELSRGLKVHVGSKYKGVVNLSSGESQFQWEEEHRDAEGQPLVVPNLFQIVIPVFRGGDLFRIAVRLRYRTGNGKVIWWYQLYRADKVFDTAFTEAATIARDGKAYPADVAASYQVGTDLPVYIGKPEG